MVRDKHLQKKERYHFDQRTSSKRSNATLTVVGWNNNRAIYVRFVRRWNKVERKCIEEQQPN